MTAGGEEVNTAIGIAEVATFFTIAGATVYALGLIGLAIPISTRFTHDTSSAWYAASLVPKTVVTGQGVRIWLRWPLTLILVGVPSKLLFPDAFYWIVSIVTIAAVLWVVFRPMPKDRRRYLSLLVVVAANVTLLFVAGTLPFLTQPNMFLATIGLFVGGFFLGVPFAINEDPPLPKVEIVRQKDATRVGEPNPLTGRLVAHSEGFWHLFDDKQDELLSVPDSGVFTTRMLPSKVNKEQAPPT